MAHSKAKFVPLRSLDHSFATTVSSEKVCSEFIVAPILEEVKQRAKTAIALFFR
jgi:hypothetical protein